jgi:RHS repeat-associated protein
MAGDGLLGRGWNLAGISVITRVPQNKYFDGKNAPVSFSTDDRFSLDGQRLILTNSINYGNNGSTYSKESDDFSVITYISGSNGADYFTVTTKDGTAITYGGTNKTVVLSDASRSVSLMWPISKIQDTRGNYIIYNYENTTDGQIKLTNIQYNKNNGDNSIPSKIIYFSYGTFSNDDASYVSGFVCKNNLKLTSINLPNAISYSFDYYNTDKLNKVNKYVNGNPACNSTVINWLNKPIATFKNTEEFGYVVSNPIDYNYRHTIGDVNGDGLVDIVNIVPVDDKLYVEFLQPDGSYSLSTKNLDPSCQSLGCTTNEALNVQVLDCDKDGKAEILVNYRSYKVGDNNTPASDFHNKVVLYKWSDGLNRIETNFDETTEYLQDVYQYYYCDIDNDGTIDRIITKTSGTTSDHAIYNITINDNVLLSSALYDMNQVYDIRFLDFDGDGQMEMMTLDNFGYGKIYKFNGSDFITGNTTSIYFGMPTSIFMGDFNGDGKTDFLRYSNGWKTFYSTGVGFEEKYNVSFLNRNPITENDPYNEASYALITDMNGDGKDDIVYSFKNIINIYLSKGMSFTSSVVNVTPVDPNDNIKLINLQPLTEVNGQKSILYIDNYNLKIKRVSFNDFLDISLYVSNITDGNSNISTITYNPYHDYSSPEEIFPLRILRYPIHIATNVQLTNGSNIYSNITYSFNNGKLNLQGKGFLGFSTTTATDAVTGNIVITSYKLSKDLDPSVTFYAPVLFSIDNYTNTNWLSHTKNTYSLSDLGNGRFFQYLSKTETTDELTLLNSSVETTIDPSNGDVTNVTKKYGTDVSESSVFSNFDGNAFRKPQTITTNRTQGGGSYVSTQSLTYQALTGNVLSSTDNNGIATTFEYSNNKTNINCALSKGIKTIYTYSSDKCLIAGTETQINGVSKYTEQVNYWFDKPARSIDKNGLVSLNLYDNYNNLSMTLKPDGRRVAYTYGRITSGENPAIASYTKSVDDAGNVAATYFDCLGRTVRKQSIPAGGQQVTIDYFFVNNLLDHELSSVDGITQYQYNPDRRLQSVTSKGYTVSYNYTIGSSTVTTTAGGVTSSKTYNAAGQVTSVADNGGSISYTYHATGQPKTITTNGSTVVMDYYSDNDAIAGRRGQQKLLTDPDAGTTTYDYGSYGRLETQTDANGYVTKMYYDGFGRVYKKEYSQLGSITRTINYTFDPDNSHFGYLSKETDSESGISTSYSYDRLGNVTQKTDRIDNTDYTFQYTYDIDSKLTKTIYPDGISVSQGYTGSYVTSITDDNINSSIFSTAASSYNARGQLASYRLGSNSSYNNVSNVFDAYGYLDYSEIAFTSSSKLKYDYTFDHATRNLSNRARIVNSGMPGALNIETFQYDNNDRLLNWNIGSAAYSMNYSGNGNIVSKSDMGSYVYSPSKPHAVDNVSPLNGSTFTVGSTCSLTYTKFNKTSKIHPTDKTDPAEDYVITYGPDDQRRKSVYNGITKTYVGLYEKRSNGDVLHYISTPDGICAVLVTNSSTGTRDMYYLYNDYQGSLISVANGNGAKITEFAYDPWGRRRTPDDWNNYNVSVDNGIRPLFTYGYTGQEHIDAFGLINMNGRMYDPRLGRFLGPDPYVQAPNNSQSYNRYSYCMNNPLKYTDPSGYYSWGEFWDDVGDVWDGITSVTDQILGNLIDEQIKHIGEVEPGGMTGKVAPYQNVNSEMFSNHNGISNNPSYKGLTKAFLFGLIGSYSLSAVILIDNIDANWGKDISDWRLHAFIVGYDYTENKTYWVWSDGLSTSERLNMAFETIYGLSNINEDYSYVEQNRNYEWQQYTARYGWKPGYFREYSFYKNVVIPFSKIGETADYIKNIYYPYWYRTHFDANNINIPNSYYNLNINNFEYNDQTNDGIGIYLNLNKAY